MNCTKVFKEELILILQNSSKKKNRKEWILLYSSWCCCSLAKTYPLFATLWTVACQAQFIIQCQYYLHTETTQRHHKEIKLQATISLMDMDTKLFNKIVANYNPTTYEWNYTSNQSAIYAVSSMQGWSGNQLIQCTILIFIFNDKIIWINAKTLTKSNILS